MSPILSSQGVALATAMAVSTILLLVYHRSPLRSSISSEKKKRETKKKKKVRFAEDVVDSRGDGKEFRRQLRFKNRPMISSSSSSPLSSSSPEKFKNGNGVVNGGMPANRVALYNGILRDRVVHHRFPCYSY